MKKIPLVLLLALGLSACGTTLTTYQGTGFSIDYPKDWKKVNTESIVDLPKVEAMFVSQVENMKDTSQQQALIVMKRESEQPFTPDMFTRDNIKETASAPNYMLVSDEDITTGGLDTTLHTFKAKQTGTSIERLFLQTYVSKDKTGYVISVVVPSDTTEKDVTELKKILKSFKFVEGK